MCVIPCDTYQLISNYPLAYTEPALNRLLFKSGEEYDE